ncbi:MAG: VWA-like domain-containing protein [Nitrososphaerota archaeon]
MDLEKQGCRIIRLPLSCHREACQGTLKTPHILSISSGTSFPTYYASKNNLEENINFSTAIEKIRREYDLVKSTLYVTAPFISSLLARARVVVNKSVPTAAVSKEGVIVINPDFWEHLDWTEKAWVISHETLHLAFRDHKRRGQRDAGAFNIVCDAINNELLKELINMPKRLEAFSVTMDKLYEVLQPQMDFEDFLKLGKEELYKLLPKIPEGGGAGEKEVHVMPSGFEEIGDIGQGDSSSGEVIQEGDPSIYKDGKESDGEEVDERWRENIARAYDLQKSIGRVPLGLKRIVDELLKSKIRWQSLLKQALKVGFGKIVVESWKRASRKADDFPGVRRFTLPTVWTLIDMSASISDEEAKQFLSEVYDIAGHYPVKVICWDTRAYDIIEAKSRNEVIIKVLNKLRGYGGTEIRSALEKTISNMRFRDVVVVLTDGEIYDIDLDEVKQLLSDVASKASIAILVSTRRELNIPNWRFIKLI